MNNVLDKLRKEIDSIDEQLLSLLAKRTDVVRKIGEIKKKHRLKVFDEKRWQEVLESTLSKASRLNLSKSFIKKLYGLIHAYSLEVERGKNDEKS